MHRALGISEVVQRIVDEFRHLQPGFSLADEQKALVPLARVNILFSQYALMAIWRDAGIIPLRKLPGYPEWLGYPPASQEPNEEVTSSQLAATPKLKGLMFRVRERLENISKFFSLQPDLSEPRNDAIQTPTPSPPLLGPSQTAMESRAPHLIDYVRMVKKIIPILNITSQDASLLDALASSKDFSPLSLYCAAGVAGYRERLEIAQAYTRLLKDSLTTVVLYVEYDQSFPWRPILNQLPPNLKRLLILPMAPITKSEEAPASLPMADTRLLLKACFTIQASLQTLELRFLNHSITNLVLSHLRQLPKLAHLTISTPGASFPDIDTDHNLIQDEVNAKEWASLNESLTNSHPWPTLETLALRDYPLSTAQRILGSCTSPYLASVSLRMVQPEETNHLGRLIGVLYERWTNSLTSFRFEGDTTPDGDPVADVNKIFELFAGMAHLRSLHIDSAYVTKYSHDGHLRLLNGSLPLLEHFHITQD